MGTFDTIVVGGGPCGLTLATYLPGRTLLLERDAELGGCHKVRRDGDGFFGEHGPRVYSGSYVNTARVLRDIGLSWDDVFVPAAFSPERIDGKRWYRWLSARESLVLTLHFCMLLADPSHGRRTTMADMCRAHGFSMNSMRYLDSVCRFSDGAGLDRYSLHEFLRGFNDHWPGFFEPRRSHDALLFPHWRRVLGSRGVDVRTSAAVRAITHRDGQVTGVRVRLADKSEATFSARRVVLAVPPRPAAALLRRSGLQEPGLHAFAEATEYDEYFSVTFHFPASCAPLVTHAGVRDTPWGLMYMEMSRYTGGEATQTAFVSVAASRLHVRSPATGKTVHESGRDEVVREMLRQLPIDESAKTQLVRAVVSSGLRRRASGWEDADEAYVFNPAHPSGWPADLTCCRGLHTVGSHNARAWYPFTSFESAVCNALLFAGQRQDEPITLLATMRLALAVIGLMWLAHAFR